MINLEFIIKWSSWPVYDASIISNLAVLKQTPQFDYLSVLFTVFKDV